MRYRETKKTSKGTSKSTKIVEEKKSSYPTRYVGELSPKGKIVEEQIVPSYKSRYK